jgi:uncharacterized protein (DUF1697 family)
VAAAAPVTFVALIRGINVGKAKRVAMADLRALVTGLGFTRVRTLLNSGNVVFAGRGAPRGIATRIERAMTDSLGVSAAVIVLSAAELAGILTRNPLARRIADPSRGFVAVLRAPGDRSRLAALTHQDWAPDGLALGARAAYFWCPNGMLQSALAERLLRAMGDAGTTRNWATMRKLLALVSEDSD